MKFLWIATLLISTQVRGESIESWNDFKTLVNRHQISNIDELISHLPKDYTDGFSLIYRSRALHQEKVSAARPRVLFFGQNALFSITYNSHKNGGRARPGDTESIETLEFEPTTGEHFLREISFSNRVPDLSRVAVNPPKCLACHSSSPNSRTGIRQSYYVRGLWDPYNSWSGVYGSLSRQGVDFIKIGTPEHQGFLAFLAEKPKNPRYAFLNLQTQNLSQLPKEILPRGFDSAKMNDAVAFSDGYTFFPNQNLGMYLADYNFQRVGAILASQNLVKRAAFQYLVKGISLDEAFAKIDIDPFTNPTDLNSKKFACLSKISNFLPDHMNKIPFDKFADIFLQKLRADYSIRKAAVEIDNMGLTKLGAGFDPKDPFDENRGPRGLEFDSINPASKFHLQDPQRPGLSGNAALFYLLYLMDLPSQDISTAITRGVNFQVDPSYVLSGSTSLYYGNSVRCYTPDGKIKGRTKPFDPQKRCFSEAVEEFFSVYLPDFFYEKNGALLDSDINQMNCDQLAARSKQALGRYFRSR